MRYMKKVLFTLALLLGAGYASAQSQDWKPTSYNDDEVSKLAGVSHLAARQGEVLVKLHDRAGFSADPREGRLTPPPPPPSPRIR